MSTIITTNNLSKSYGETIVLHDINLSINEGSFTVFIGPSGCGKSTLLKLITGIELPSSGTFTIPTSMTMVFQNGSLLPWLSVYDNVMLGLEEINMSPTEKDISVKEMLNLMELDAFLQSYPRDLSGGQRQRVGIARALVSKPNVLLLDEPFSALDAETTENLHAELLKIWKEKKLTIVMISHSLDEAVELADTIYTMKAGKVINSQVISLARPRDQSTIEFHNIKQSLKKLL
jgi:NitT/TauT family transport system ATP-binding protein